MKSDAIFTIYSLSTVMCHDVESVKVAVCHPAFRTEFQGIGRLLYTYII